MAGDQGVVAAVPVVDNDSMTESNSQQPLCRYLHRGHFAEATVAAETDRELIGVTTSVDLRITAGLMTPEI